MREQILRFLGAIDNTLEGHATRGERLDLYVIGKSALILFHGVDGAAVTTADVDVVQVSYPPARLLQLALEQFGKESSAPATYGLYLEAVHDGLPPVPGGFRQRCRPLSEGDWKVLTVQQLEVHDLAVTKLKRFAPKDRQDLRELCDRELLEPAKLKAALESAFRWTTDKDGDPNRDRAFEHLRRVIAYIEGEASEL